MRLYEINVMYEEFLFALERGEIPDEAISDTLAGLDGLLEEKADNIACILKELAADIAAIKAEETALSERRRTKEGNHERLKSYLSNALLSVGKDKIETPRNKLSFRKSTALHILDAKMVLDDVKFLKPRKWDESEIDKTAVKEALAAGVDVPGAELRTSMNLQVK